MVQFYPVLDNDLLGETGNLKLGAEIFQQLKGYRRANWLMEYTTILKSIPKTWKDMLKNINMNVKVRKELKPFIYTGKQYIYELPSKIKDYHAMLISKTKEKLFMEKHWDNIFPHKPS